MTHDEFLTWEKALLSIADDKKFNCHNKPCGFDVEINLGGEQYYVRIRNQIAKNLNGLGYLEDILAKDAEKNNRDVPSMIRFIIGQYYKEAI